MLHVRQSSLAIAVSILVACSSPSSSNPSPTPLDEASLPADPPVVGSAQADGEAPRAPGPSFTVPSDDLVIEHPRAPARQSKYYAARIDPSEPVGGQPSMLLESTEGATSSGFAATTATVEVDSRLVGGRRYRMRAKIKTENAFAGWLWWRIDSPGAFKLDNMRTPVDRRINGTHEWREVQLVLDVPEGAWSFAFGSGLVGTGKVWVGEITFDEVGPDYPPTPSFDGDL